jgi:signal transduction histidine kinase
MGASMMLDTFDADDGSPWKRRIASIQHAAQRMDRLIRDLLDTATIDAGRLSIEVLPVRLQQLVTDSVETFAPLASGKSIRIKSELNENLPAVAGDPDRLEQVLANLLGNALKFTQDGGQITIGAECTDRSVIVSVTDDGPGMSQEELDHLFDRFWQARRTAALGTGLGLFIVKGIIETHGGSVWVESTLGVGSTFFVELPRALAPAPLGKERSQQREARVTLAVRAAQTVANRKSRLRSADMVVISKELRGPLTALELLTERLQRSRHTPPSPEQQRIVRRMFATITRMTAAVESIMQYGRIQAEQLSAEIESFDLVVLVREVADQLRPCADEKSIELCVSAPRRLPSLQSDRELVRLIVLNLVDNAIKVTDRGLVSIFIDSAADGHHLAVVDAGPGIPPDQRVRIFEPFAKAENEKSKFVPGIGLGLTLVRDLAAALGGRVQLDSEVGCGTTFTVILPAAPEAVEMQQLPFH